MASVVLAVSAEGEDTTYPSVRFNKESPCKFA